MTRVLLIALLLASPSSAANLPSPNWPAPADRADSLLRQTVLSVHNQARSQFGVPSVRWSEQLAGEAYRHAFYMARTGIYGHDQTPGRRKKAGENLWRGQRGVFSYDVMIGLMVEEAQHFRPGVFPDVSRTGRWSDVGHFTQIVWPSTTEVGCALASSASTDYFVCRYAPAGNMVGVALGPKGAGDVKLAKRGD